MTAEPLVACVILNFNRLHDTLDCLRSLSASSYGNLSIWVLDCQPSGHSRAAMQSVRADVHVVPLHNNRGYAGNNNIGIGLAVEHGAEWVFVLNDDVIVAPDAIANLVAAANGEPLIGIVGPLVFHADEPQVVQSAGGVITRFWTAKHARQNELDGGQFSTPHPVDWISGCAIMIRRAVIESIGMIDERFFLYWEEVEWCVRAAQAGWTVLHVPAARIWHKGVQRNYRPGPSVTYYSTRNHLLLLSARRAPFIARLAVWSQIVRTLVSWTVRPKWRGKRPHRDAMWEGAVDFVRRRYGPR